MAIGLWHDGVILPLLPESTFFFFKFCNPSEVQMTKTLICTKKRRSLEDSGSSSQNSKDVIVQVAYFNSYSHKRSSDPIPRLHIEFLFLTELVLAFLL